MQYRKSAIAVVAALAATLAVATPASAAWRGGGWHRGWHGGGWHGRGVELGLGLATGAIVGSALAAPYYYGGYGYGYGPYAYDGGYDDAYAAAPGGYGYGPSAYDEGYDNAYAAAPAYGGERDDQYCAQRYRSYDPSSGTFLGYDGARHPCP